MYFNETTYFKHDNPNFDHFKSGDREYGTNLIDLKFGEDDSTPLIYEPIQEDKSNTNAPISLYDDDSVDNGVDNGVDNDVDNDVGAPLHADKISLYSPVQHKKRNLVNKIFKN